MGDKLFSPDLSLLTNTLSKCFWADSVANWMNKLPGASQYATHIAAAKLLVVPPILHGQIMLIKLKGIENGMILIDSMANRPRQSGNIPDQSNDQTGSRSSYPESETGQLTPGFLLRPD